MSRRTLNLVAVAAAAAVLVWIVSGLVAGGKAATDPVAAAETSEPAALPSPSVPPPDEGPELRGYALSVPHVDGLPPDLQPGDRLQLWVAWDPPLTKGPRIEPLVDKVVYERTIAPVVPGEPPTAVVLVPETKVDELMWGDRYGALSVALLSR